MKPFKAPVEDILFSLEHVANAARLPEWDGELVSQIVQHFAEFAEGEIAPVDEPGDIEGCRLEDGRVKMPNGFAEVFRSYAEQGWTGLSVPEAYGGQGMGGPVLAATSEIFTGACHSLQMVTGLVPGMVRTLLDFGTEAQREVYIALLAEGKLLATMCLTEPGSGSDLSTVRTRAVADDGKWLITGEKIFISGGDQDMSEDVAHLVLARTGTLEEGIRGLSLFICRSTRPDGSRNGISITRIEEKMGLHASPTCQIAFDNMEAELVGKPGEGLKCMFTMMNHARIDVALQGVAHAARAHDVAAAYADERKQGRIPGVEGSAPIAHHPHVRNMLDEQAILAIGGRAMCHYAQVALETSEHGALVDFLTPVCKSFCTEAGMRSADLGIQILGGYGYLREYRLEQIYRDARITAIYEGTNGIHALTLATRLLRLDNGAPADAFLEMLREISLATADDGLSGIREIWQGARNQMAQAGNPAEAADDFMVLTAHACLHAMWSLIEAKADHHPDPERMRRLARKAKAFAVRKCRFAASALEMSDGE
ncbi:MAG: acyl-CoA dehydrogenase family protein [Nitratireductor sp.]|nr:acyl-CoA dehydrogenase family protein [Nitratireductor sp.]MCC0022228.1 acyl-CoA dehydrogenase family protein [Nitratireductor sp.]